MSNGKRWAYGGAIVGASVSVLANVAHSFVPAQPDGMSDEAWRMLPGASPQLGAVFLAAFWPLALLLAIEVMARVEWPRQLRWTLVRWGGVSPVAVVAAVVSYLHLSGLLHWYGEDPLTVTIGPAAVDGLMVVSTGALLALASQLVPVADPIAQSPEEPSAQEPSAEPIQSDADGRVRSDALADRLDGSVDSEAVGSAAPPEEESNGSGRVVALRSVPSRSDRVAPTAARPEDLRRAREAIRAGQLSESPTADAIRDHLKIGLKNARRVRDHLQDQQQEA